MFSLILLLSEQDVRITNAAVYAVRFHFTLALFAEYVCACVCMCQMLQNKDEKLLENALFLISPVHLCHMDRIN